MPSPLFDPEAIEAEIDRIRSLGVDELRSLWRATFRASPPPGFTKDLIARFLCWHLQEQAFGGLDPKTAKHLAGVARGDRSRVDRPMRLKPGTVLRAAHRHSRCKWLCLARDHLCQPLHHRPSHHRDELEWTALLWPPDRQGDASFAGPSRCAAPIPQWTNSFPDR
jgi:Protein of unknown function (DUF2924)